VGTVPRIRRQSETPKAHYGACNVKGGGKDEDERAAFLTRLLSEMDYQSDISAALEKGEKIGEEKGIDATKKDMACKLLNLGMSEDFITATTGFNSGEIKELKATLAQAPKDAVSNISES
jgi:hypothetical protein